MRLIYKFYIIISYIHTHICTHTNPQHPFLSISLYFLHLATFLSTFILRSLLHILPTHVDSYVPQRMIFKMGHFRILIGPVYFHSQAFSTIRIIWHPINEKKFYLEKNLLNLAFFEVIFLEKPQMAKNLISIKLKQN